MGLSLNPKQEAEKVLASLWKENSFPIDPAVICARLSLQVVETKMPDNVSGALIKEKNDDPIVALNKNDHLNRKRFTCAHELGHYISRIESNEIQEEYSFIDYRDALSASGIDPKEKFANAFAANLLMPEEEIKNLLKQKKQHFQMAIHFGVSPESIKYRLNSLGLSK